MGGRFLLQIWSKIEQKKIFERVHKNLVTYWSSSNEYIIYKPPDKDQNIFYLVNCENGCSILKVQDWIGNDEFTFAVYGGGSFTLASPFEI